MKQYLLIAFYRKIEKKKAFLHILVLFCFDQNLLLVSCNQRVVVGNDDCRDIKWFIHSLKSSCNLKQQQQYRLGLIGKHRLRIIMLLKPFYFIILFSINNLSIKQVIKHVHAFVPQCVCVCVNGDVI
eukprot:TRINITY_DN6445_c0_g1_i1.p3 TRINITY_DN6445_c0_g1~~TRINITY_DN6445_c0_g1_i1.p3  ORF type:complete len:127 (+),score=1.37 TRINITY_DN6445_c0_g1_i1:1571-1951(+)